ncbi:MAG: hypothetical protein QXK94_05035 [Candidatus Jordarchaeales archaeon]
MRSGRYQMLVDPSGVVAEIGGDITFKRRSLLELDDLFQGFRLLFN